MRIACICLAMMLFVSATAGERGYRDPDKNCMYFTKEPPAVFFAFSGKYWTFFANAKTLLEAESMMSDMGGSLLMSGVSREDLPRVLVETHQMAVPDTEKRDVQVKRDGTVVAPEDAKVAIIPGFSVWTGDEISCVSPQRKEPRIRGAVVYENEKHF